MLMAAAVIFFAGVLAVIYYLSQRGTEADAPGHCMGATKQMGNRLGFEDLVNFAQQAGFDTDSQTAAAIALAESNGDMAAYNPETQADTPEGKGSVGLWQIYRNAHPEYDCVDLTDPQANANAAYEIYVKAGGFSPWSTFKSGVYQKFLPA